MAGQKTTNSVTKSIISWTVFLFAIAIVLTSTVPVIFPAVFTLSENQIPGITQVGPDKFETGVWAGGVFAANAIVFGLAFLHFKKNTSLAKPFQKLFSFELSKKVSWIIVVTILLIYIAASAGELSIEESWGDYSNLKNRLDIWSPDQITGYEPHVKYAIVTTSMTLFGSYAVLPFVASILLVLLTYLVTVQITQKRFAGIVSMIVLIQSNVFLTYDTSVTYSNFWILFYLASLYFAKKVWLLSPVAFILSIPSKALTAAFAPMSIYYFLREDIPRYQKIIICAATAMIVIVGAAAVASGLDTGEAKEEGFSSQEFWTGFASFANQLRLDGLVILFMIPLIVGLFIASRNGVIHADSIMVLISGILLIAPILTGFTTQTNQPYRFVPLVVFFAIGVGVLLSKRRVE